MYENLNRNNRNNMKVTFSYASNIKWAINVNSRKIIHPFVNN